jgi:hypothetical protein
VILHAALRRAAPSFSPGSNETALDLPEEVVPQLIGYRLLVHPSARVPGWLWSLRLLHAGDFTRLRSMVQPCRAA